MGDVSVLEGPLTGGVQDLFLTQGIYVVLGVQIRVSRSAGCKVECVLTPVLSDPVLLNILVCCQ